MHIHLVFQDFRKLEFYYCLLLFPCYTEWVQNAGKPTKEHTFCSPAAQGQAAPRSTSKPQDNTQGNPLQSLALHRTQITAYGVICPGR